MKYRRFASILGAPLDPRALIVGLVIWFASNLPVIALAQQDDRQRQIPSNEIEEIVVTGTRLSNPNLTSSSPVSVLTENQIRLAGDPTAIETLLNQMPQFSPADASSTTFTPDAEILSSADLRGLGPQRTLVLVDGTRYVPATTNGVVDLNTIPSALVERIEIVTGGASAVYGSDAIAGVVNFRLKDDYDGVQLRASSNITGEGDGLAYEIGLTTGVNLDSGRGNVVLDVTYSDRDELLGSDRAFAMDQLADNTCVPGSLDGRGAGTASNDPDAVPCYTATGSGTLPAGTINNSFTFDENGNPISPRPPGLFDDFFDYNYIQLPLERWTGTTLARYSLNDHAEVYSRLVYTSLDTARNQHSTSTSGSAAFGINLDNPYVTPGTRSLLEPLDTDGDGVAYVDLSRRFVETGPRQVLLNSNAFQAQVGLRGDISDNWRYNTYYQYGRVDRNEQFRGDIARSRLQQSLLATTNLNGEPVCIDPSFGCVPANIFGTGNVSAASADFLRTTSTRSTEAIEKVLSAYVTGDLGNFMELPGGKVNIVVGTEWRDVDASTRPDNVLQRETLAQPIQFPTEGGYSVTDVFGEVQLPLLEDVVLAKSLMLKGAVRISDYSLDGVENVVTWNAGTRYEPTDGLTFRAEFQHAIRAPNVRELYQGTQFVIANMDDPCSNRIPVEDQTPELEAICLATGVPQSEVFGNLQPGSNEISSRAGGNTLLQEEESDTLTAGVIYSPTFADGLTVTIDYYNIDIENAIGFFGGGAVNTMNLCYYGFQDAQSVYCQAVQRSSTTGQVDFVAGDFANVSKLETSGVDFQATHSIPLSVGLTGQDSLLTIDLRGTYVIDKTTQAEPAADILECVSLFGSRCGEPTPEWKLNTSFLWSSGPLDLNFQWRYLSGESWDSQYTFANDFLGRGQSFEASSLKGVEIGSANYFDLSGKWTFADNIDLVFGIDNLFDKEPPIVGASKDENSNTWPGTYDAFGRRFFASVALGF